MRVASFHKFDMAHNYINNLDSEMAKKFEQISTGKNFNRPSDNPIRVNESMLLERTQMKIDQYNTNINDAKNLLEYIDMVYETSVESLHMALEAANRGANDFLSDVDRKVIAEGIEENIQQILSFANSKHLDRYMFSGQNTDQVAISYDGEGFTYNGNEESLKISISANMSVNVSQSAEDVFIPVLESLIKLRNGLNDNDTEQIQASYEELNGAFTSFVDNRSKMGTQLKSVELMEEAYIQTATDLENKRTKAEGIDMVKAYSQYEQLELIYQATLQSTMVMMRTSVLDYL